MSPELFWSLPTEPPSDPRTRCRLVNLVRLTRTFCLVHQDGLIVGFGGSQKIFKGSSK